MGLRKGILSLVDKFGFYSKAESVATEMPQKIMTGEQARAFFKKKGVKNEELDHLKLDDLFEKDNVTQDEIYETIEKNRIGFREERTTESDIIDDDDRQWALEHANAEVGREVRYDETPLSFEEAHGVGAFEKHVRDQVDSYLTVTGGSGNYSPEDLYDEFARETLREYESLPVYRLTLTLPDADWNQVPVTTTGVGPGVGKTYELVGNETQGFWLPEDRESPRELRNYAREVQINSVAEAENVLFAMARNAGDVGLDDRVERYLRDHGRWGEYTLPGGENYQETRLALELPEHRGLFSEDVHYPEDYDDVFAIRTKDRKGPNGEKILYVEELQSDWAQRGRGQFLPRDYDKNPPQSDFEAYERALRKSIEARTAGAPDEQLRKLDDEANRLAEPFFGPEGAANRATTKPDLDRAEQMVSGGENKELKKNRRFRHAPFVEKTESWNQLAIKRILRMAEEEGYDGVAFTPSQVQIDRWKTPGLRVQYDVAIPAALKSVTGRSYNNPDANNVMIVTDQKGVEHKSEIISLDDPSKDGKTIRETAKEGYPMLTVPVAGAGIASLALGEDAAATESDAPDLSFMQRLSGMINNRFPDEVIEDVNQQIGQNIEGRKKQEFLKSIRKETQDLSRQFRKQFPEEEEKSFTFGEHLTGAGELIKDMGAALLGPVAQAGAPAFASAFLPEGQTLTPDQWKKIGEEARVKFDEYDPQTEAGRWQKEQAMKEVESLLTYLGDESSPDLVPFLFQKGVMPALEAFEPIEKWLQDRILDFTSRKQTLFGEEESPEMQEARRETDKPLSDLVGI